MRAFPLHALLSLGALLTLGAYARRLGFLPEGAVLLGLGLYGALSLYGLRFGRAYLFLLLGLLAPWFPPAPFAVPLVFALAFGRRLPEKAQGAVYGWALVWPALALLLVWHVFPALYAFYLSLQGARFDLGVAPLPGRAKGQPGFGLVQGTNLVVFRQAPKEEQAVAKDFLQFVLSPRAQAVFATATGYVPVTEGALKDPAYQAYAAENPDYATIVRQSRYAKFEPALAEWEQIRFDILGQAIKEAVLNKADPKAALDKTQKLAEDLLAGKTR
uniref:Extracellular solute-binding protein n=1 Tax=Thermus islandicus TaxID=540988 RepID=A0A7C2C030_9DEIN